MYQRDLEPAEDQVVAVPFTSDRRGYNCVKLTAIIHEVVQSTSNERIVMDKLKTIGINDNHLYRMRLADCAAEIEGFFSSAFPENVASVAANLFRLKILDRITSKCVQPPKTATEADYKEAARWVDQQHIKHGSLLRACSNWLTHRNVELIWWRLQKQFARISKEREPSLQIVNVGGRQRHMSDIVFLKYVVPIMQSSGVLKHSVEVWMNVMCAVDMLQNVRPYCISRIFFNVLNRFQGMISVDRLGHVDRYDDGVKKAVWSGALPASGRHPNQPARYVPFPKDRATAAKYLKRFDLSTRAQEPLGPHRLAADPDQVQSVFDDLETRMRLHNITEFRQVLVTDEFRLKKEMERVIAAIQAVCSSNENRVFMSSLGKVVEGATCVPVSTVLGETIIIQIVCRDGDRKTPAEDVKQLFRAAGYTCPVLVCYSDSGYQTSETNKELKDAVILTLGSKYANWEPGQPLPEHYILIEDGASMHGAADIAHSLYCLTSGLVVHHVAANSTHFSQLFDRIVFLIAKLLSIKELSLRIQAMTCQKPANPIARAGWCCRVMSNCVIQMNTFDINNSSLQDQRNAFMAGFLSNRDAEVAAMDRKLDDIFEAAARARNKCDELFLLSAIAPAMLIALQPKYVVKSAMMVGLLPPNFELGVHDHIPCGVWPEVVMRNPLVELQTQRRENERNFMHHQEIAIRETLSSIGIEADQQILSAAPPLSSAGEKAALDAAPDAVWNAYKRSRLLDHLNVEESKKFQALVGDFHLFKHQVERQESRTSTLTGLRGFNTRTEAACQALLETEQEEMMHTTLALVERSTRFGASKFNAVIIKSAAASRHLSLLEKAASASKAHHSSNLDKCQRNATEDLNSGESYYATVDQALSKVRMMQNDELEEARLEFFQLHQLADRAREEFYIIRQLVARAAAHAANSVANDVPMDNAPGAAAGLAPVVLEAGLAPGAAPAPAPAAVAQRPQRKCSKCGSCTHQSNSSKCPHNNEISDEIE